jgi:membrane fusion protein, copper/silver efflux system
MKLNFSKKDIGMATGILVLGVFLGWVFFSGNGNEKSAESTEQHDHSGEEMSTRWTCSMHPQINKDKPGKCPICGMTLIPLDNGEEEELSLSEIKMSKSAMKIAEVETIIIEKKAPYKEVYFPGKVQPDERNIVELTARFGGRIEKLFINFTGQKVRKGQKLASIYSPDLVTAQKELFEAIKYKENNSAFYSAARNKLKLWDLTDKQIDDVEETGEPIFYFDVLSPITGTVMMRHVSLGDYVKEGDPLFQVTNLYHLWVMFEGYESDLPWVKLGDKINFTIKSIPAKVFTSTVTFIDPVINPSKRVAFVRAELDNPGGLLKPEMFASGVLNAMLPGVSEAIVVPKSAILWTGKRAIVYVRVPNKEMVFEHREIGLGEDAGQYYVVSDGLEEGEEVVTNGVFKIDAASQLLSKQSMMTPAGGKSSMGGHAGMDMGGDDKKEDKKMDMQKPKKKMKAENINPKFKKQMRGIVTKYLAIKDALVIDNAANAKSAAKAMDEAIENVNMKLLTDDEHHMSWMGSAKMMKMQLKNIWDEDDIETQRKAFGKLSDDLTQAIKSLGVDMGGKSLYLEFCPMANNNKGSYWISLEKKIMNPFFGQKMLKCGEVKETMVTN